ncbi:uncharacterized protein Pyn_16334 [Prunus yedoensis var. nudiflora]|uniref:NAC domain-containing protein n=1 Tax=Prunus yedoensis var. nudiflora TaxID=2094558 RepID=A0A314YBA1_PRUYE|nr:uncharacterized protein Pyn_16334 [Prunus yedoensis var. nudiflora]
MVGSGGCGSGGGEMSSSSTTGEGDSKQMDLPGYKFSPTGEELVGFYLKKKIEGKDAKFRDMIPVIDVCNHKPSDLPAFFFSQPDYKYNNSKRCNRSTDEGFYKSTGKVREIKAEQSQAVIGNKRILSYYEGRVPKAKKTKHVMHEYSLTKTKLAQLGAQNNQQRELVLCHLTNKSAKSEKLKDDSICSDELAEPAIGGEIASNSEDDQADATDMIQGPDEHLADKDVLLGTENHNECAESESPNGFSPTENNDISTCVGSPGSFDVPGGFFLSDFDDLFNEPSCADLEVNMDSTFLPPQQLAATSATTPTSSTIIWITHCCHQGTQNWEMLCMTITILTCSGLLSCEEITYTTFSDSNLPEPWGGVYDSDSGVRSERNTELLHGWHTQYQAASIHVFTHRRCSEKNPTAKQYHKTRLGKLQSIVLLSSPENQVLEVYSSKQVTIGFF